MGDNLRITAAPLIGSMHGRPYIKMSVDQGENFPSIILHMCLPCPNMVI